VTKGSTIIGYVRVSTEEQGTEGAGLEAQKQAIEQECQRKGWTLLRIEQDVASGKSTNGRPGLHRALEAIRTGEAQGIVVAKLDRLTRSVVSFGQLLQEATKAGWNIVALDFGLDLSTPQGKLVANVLVSVAEWEREMIGLRTKEALAVRKAQGVRLGREQVIAPELADRIRAMRDSGMTLRAVARQLNTEGIPAPVGSEWRHTSFRSLLKAAS
jgi:DNA invertase Pin-like site-specific DNA recombinase